MSELSLNKIDNLVGSVNSEIYIGYIKDKNYSSSKSSILISLFFISSG